jgi:hypothetical protein
VRRTDDRDREERGSRRQREAGGSALPRPVDVAEHRPLRKDRDRVAALECARQRGDGCQVPSPPLDRDPAEPVEQPAGDRVRPELVLREEVEWALDGGAEKERVRERVVVGHDDRRAGGDVLRADDLEAPHEPQQRAEDRAGDAIENHVSGQPRIASAVSSARRS